MGDYKTAIKNYTGSGEDNAACVVHYNTANVYKSMGEIESALEYYAMALENREDRKELLFRLHFNLGNTYYEINRFDRAKEYFIEALKYNPDSVKAKINLELALVRQQEEKTRRMNNDPGRKRKEERVSRAGSELLKELEKSEREIINRLIKKKEKNPVSGGRDW